MSALISMGAMVLAAALLFFLVTRSTRRRRVAGEIRDQLDPRTARWLEDRAERRSGKGLTDAHGGILATSDLEQSPAGASRVRVYFVGDSLYLMVSGWKTITGWSIRGGAIQVADYLASQLPPTPPPPAPPHPRPEQAV